jgi:hypothetical protein
MSFRFALFAVFVPLLPTTALAQWTSDGVPISAAANAQQAHRIVSDGAGGAIVAWQDQRVAAHGNIYSQRIAVSGAVQWTMDGVPVCPDTTYQADAAIVSDGAGGAIVTWRDQRAGNGVGNADIYAQRLDASGAVLWDPAGVPVCTAAGDQGWPEIALDGSEAAIVVWEDVRSGGAIYAQRIDASGAVQWTANGVAVALGAGIMQRPLVISDGAGGAIVTWADDTGTSLDTHAQRINASGVRQWAVGGVPLCIDPFHQFLRAIVSDGAGGAIVAWDDGRNTPQLAVQRINSSGAVQWGACGVAVCTNANEARVSPALVSDGAGGAIVAWRDNRGGTTSPDIYAQRLDSSGASLWTACGVALCTAVGLQVDPTIVADGAGGAIVTWLDSRTGNDDIYAQRTDAAGMVQWNGNGVALCADAGRQFSPRITSNEAGAAIVAWQDERSGQFTDDIYAQRVHASGTTDVGDTPTITALTVSQNHPNPFRGTTDLRIRLAADSEISIEMFDVTGRRVRTQSFAQQEAGWRTISFDGRSDSGRPLSSGVYLYRVTANGTTLTNKMVISR